MKLSPALRRSVRQEKEVARDTGGRRQAASGALPGLKGDVKTGNWLLEAKTTKGTSYGIKIETWRKIEREALQAGKDPAMVVDIAGRRLVIIDYQLWLDTIGG